MSNRDFVAAMLAWRRALRARRPQVEEAIKAEWQRWLYLQRTVPPNPSQPLLIVLADLSCVADIDAHVGLAQALAVEGVRPALVLSLPNASALRVARAEARRQDWEGLVKMIERSRSDALIDRLPADTPLLALHEPAILGGALLDRQFAAKDYWQMTPPGSEQAGGDGAFVAGNAFFGRARDYHDWRGQRTAPDWQALKAGIDLLSSEEFESGISQAPQVPLRRREWPEASRPLDAVAGPDRHLQLPAIEAADELVVRTAREPFHPSVIQRQPARLLEPHADFEVRLPGAMLGPAPRMVRVETHKADGRVLGENLLVRVQPSKLKPWMISCFLNRGGGGNAVIRAFAGAIGARLAYAEDEPAVLQDIPVVWGVLRDSDRILAQAQAQSLYYFYIDHAYFDRGHKRSYRITRNGYEAGAIRRCPADRIAQVGVETRAWRKSGKEIIVCPPTDYFMQAHGCADWLETTLAALRDTTDRPIIVREKPKEGESAIPLPKALETAHALVTHSSNVAIEAACLGTPVFVAPTSAAAPVGRTDLSQIEQPAYPDRDPWLAHLAYNQFSFEEIRDGRAWKMLLELEERDLA